MSRVTVLLISGCLWALMMALLVQREVLPFLEFSDPPSYRTYLRTITKPEVTRQSILMSGTRVGEIETLVVPHPNGTAEIRGWLRFELPDSKAQIYCASRASIGADYRLVKYDLRAMTSNVPISISAVRKGEKISVTVDAVIFRKTLEDAPFDSDAFLTDGFLPYPGGKLAVGKKWRVKTLDTKNLGGDLTRMATSDLYATVEERKTIRYQGREVACYEVVFRKTPTSDEEGISHIVYVNDSGVVLWTRLFVWRYAYDVHLVEKRTLTYEEASAWKCSVELPQGFKEP